MEPLPYKNDFMEIVNESNRKSNKSLADQGQ